MLSQSIRNMQVFRKRDEIRGFPKIGHSCSAARIVLKQNKFSKKLPLTGIEPLTLGLW